MARLIFSDKELPKPYQEKDNGFILDLNVTDTDAFQDLLRVLHEIIEDDRIHHPIRKEYAEKMEYIVGKYE